MSSSGTVRLLATPAAAGCLVPQTVPAVLPAVLPVPTAAAALLREVILAGLAVLLLHCTLAAALLVLRQVGRDDPGEEARLRLGEVGLCLTGLCC